MKCSNKNMQVMTMAIAFLGGAALLCGISFVQKLVAGYNPFIPKGYVVAFLLGGGIGCWLICYFNKVKIINQLLEKQLNTLESLLPICAQCKRIRRPDCPPEQNSSWQQLETYISQRTDYKFSHTICPACAEKLYGEHFLNKL